MLTDTEKVSLDDMIKIGSEFWFGTLKELHAALNEQISTGEGQDLEFAIGDSTVDYELIKKTKIVYVHDLFVFTSDRGKGMATKLVKELVKKYKGHTFWLASTNPTMNRVSEKVGFEKICDKNFKNCKMPEEDLPKGIKLSNATVYRLKT
jgi:GNAT superfamily N-acetyltransferase